MNVPPQYRLRTRVLVVATAVASVGLLASVLLRVPTSEIFEERGRLVLPFDLSLTGVIFRDTPVELETDDRRMVFRARIPRTQTELIFKLHPNPSSTEGAQTEATAIYQKNVFGSPINTTIRIDKIGWIRQPK